MHRLWMVPTGAFIVMLLGPEDPSQRPQPSSARPISAQTPGCDAAIYNAFDFWIGEWEVRLASGAVAGRNTIRKVAGGCSLAESWRGASGTIGESLSHYDPADRRWHQLWIDSSGLVLRLSGEPIEGGMRMESRDRAGQAIQRITWTRLDDGRVRQHWEASADGGESWSQVFDGYYSRPADPAPDV